MRRCCLLLLLVCGALFASGTAFTREESPSYPTVRVTVNGQPVSFIFSNASQLERKPIPALLVHGHVMLPIRFFEEVLQLHFDFHLEAWKIASLESRSEGPWSFKIGDPTAYRQVAGFGGDRAESMPLPLPPMLINDRYYLPAIPVVGLFGADEHWDAKTGTLEISWKGEKK